LLDKLLNQSKIRVLIADDHALVRSSIKALLENQFDMKVVATAVNGKEAVRLAEVHHPDVIVMDITMPELDGIHATEEISSLDLSSQVVILSIHADAAIVQQALNKGAAGVVTKQRASDDLPAAVRSVHSGKRFFSASIPGLFQRDGYSAEG
jgi:DNA-binding NarL/FixJ family response regulator